MHCVAYLLLFDVNAGPADALGIVLSGPQIQIYDAACGSTRRPSRSTGSTESHCAEPVTSRVLGAQQLRAVQPRALESRFGARRVSFSRCDSVMNFVMREWIVWNYEATTWRNALAINVPLYRSRMPRHPSAPTALDSQTVPLSRVVINEPLSRLPQIIRQQPGWTALA
ncbi:hypothetical protein POSPLADRAFT_1054527 [Postia placenta MAD-698-R-SB12]|uniref:Uncharacterized protein n=1 Tax=Postia placenta MAD-698-R-SB12 TaxID=670580 RepID=A0A1X6N5L2_9APHY|nr:hypothetical protein POSPLADRAFT_1054527 [Postia placenta MAD-698-R-SB12]OSX63898.1 hypothetical protein POSPLADRAFT_1054527 [Postia placenta MAD-698-R-SB12]